MPGTVPSAATAGLGVMLTRPLQRTQGLGSAALQRDGESAQPPRRCHCAFISMAVGCELVLTPLENAGWVVLSLGLAFLHRAEIYSPSQGRLSQLSSSRLVAICLCYMKGEQFGSAAIRQPPHSGRAAGTPAELLGFAG